jgi:outer membrane protein OmpA-like peptidoglycan-associated protein
MASKIGICKNFAQCTLAYGKRPITIANTAAFCCPECGKPLTDARSPSKSRVPLLIASAVIIVIGVGLGGVFIGLEFAPKAPPGIAAAPGTGTVPVTPAAVPSAPTPQPMSETSPTPAHPSSNEGSLWLTPRKAGSSQKSPAVPPQTPQSEPNQTAPPTSPIAQKPEPSAPRAAALSPPEPEPIVENKEETNDVRRQVLARIDTLPNASPAERRKIYTAVDRAREMSKIAIIHFDTGVTLPSAPEVEALIQSLSVPEVQHKLKDPAMVLVIPGYADTTGDPRKNLKISSARAENLAKLLQNRGVLNTVRAVGMGSSTLFGVHQLAKNRIAEVWLVLP